MKTFFVAALAVVMLSGCVTKRDYDLVKTRSDSLKNELIAAHQTIAVFEQVAVIIDSIERGQMNLMVNLEKGFSFEEYTDKINRIQEFIRKANFTIASLEKSSKNNANHLTTVKWQFQKKTAEVTELKKNIEEYRNLITQLRHENVSLASQRNEWAEQVVKLEEMEMKINALIEEARTKEAKACFYEAIAWEEVARRTQFAPRRKKESLREALELYERAFELGLQEAEPKIERIRTKLS